MKIQPNFFIYSRVNLFTNFRIPCLGALIFFNIVAHGQAVAQNARFPDVSIQFKNIESVTTASLRGLCVVNKSVIWASGSEGTIVQSADAGETWTNYQLPEAKKLEFRDIQASASGSAIVLGAGSPAMIFRKSTHSKKWERSYYNANPKIFFNAFGFWNQQTGVAFSDPIANNLELLWTSDGGVNWTKSQGNCPDTYPGECGFAASGTCLTTYGKNLVWIGLGGKTETPELSFARVLSSIDRGKNWQSGITTIPRSESSGVFSMAFVSEKNGIAVGGDYKNPDKNDSNCSITSDGGKTWHSPKFSFPSGFRSCITATTDSQIGYILVATGTNGTDVSIDLGETWKRTSEVGFHAISFIPGTLKGWAVGSRGQIASFEILRKTR